jgi:hypothetical protein
MPDLLTLLVVLLVVAIVIWLINRYVPMPAPIRVVATAIVVTILCCWLLGAIGFGAYNGALMGFVCVCLIIYLLETLWWPGHPNDAGLRNIIHIVLVIILIVWLLYAFGLVGSLRIPIRRI